MFPEKLIGKDVKGRGLILGRNLRLLWNLFITEFTKFHLRTLS
jgi:hypothetical protein